MSRVWTSRSNGQRSRSQCKDYTKWFLAHNCFPFLVHNLGRSNGCRGGYFVPLGQPHASFFLACFARQYYTNILHVYILRCSMFSMELPYFLYISLIQINSNPLRLWKSIFIFCLELHDFTSFKPKFFWRTPSSPFPYTFTISKLPCHMYVCVERVTLPKINLSGKSI